MSKIYEALKRAEQERELSRSSPRVAPSFGRSLVSSAPEDYRRLAAAFLLSGGTARLHSVVVTAARHGEGVTETTLGLAAAVAREGREGVVVLEANVRRPALRERLGLGNCAALSDYLRGEVPVEEIVRHVARLGVHVVPGGTPLGQLDQKLTGALLEELSSRFELVLVDAPPVNEYADAAVLSSRADGAVLVVEADHTQFVELEAAKRSLEKAGAQVLGVVLNRCRTYIPRPLRAFF